MNRLFVFREFKGAYERVGMLERRDAQTRFSYCDDYLASAHAQPISALLPLGDRPFNATATRVFFDALTPEGSLRRAVRALTRTEGEDYFEILDLLRNEPIGALVFSDDEELAGLHRAYEPLAFEAVRRFASSPAEESLSFTAKSRISLAGAQQKIGLYHVGDDPRSGWYLPMGAAPSTHILKVCSGSFPRETVCEALCLRAAKLLDLSACDCFLVDAGGREPVLAVERYDRRFEDGDVRRVDGLPVPMRLHQEDMCQASGVPSSLKYEPTDANYLNLMAHALRRNSTDFNGDRFMLAYYELFHYLVGNCDNHLKNWSMLWSEDWESRTLAPLYDVVGTTIYPSLLREMGVSLCASRVIDAVGREDVVQRLRTIGISGPIAESIVADMADGVSEALAEAAQGLSDEGFPDAATVFALMSPGVQERAERLRG